jgi:predicted PurR-regulated permease PerM
MKHNTTLRNFRTYDILSWGIMGLGLLLVLMMHLLPALLAGLLVYELVQMLLPFIHLSRIRGNRAKLVAVAFLAIVIIALLTLLIVGSVAFFRSGTGSLSNLLQKMAEIIEGSRTHLPEWLVENLPTDAEDLRIVLVDWLREHAGELRIVGQEALRAAVHILMGMVIGAILALHQAAPAHTPRPLAQKLAERASRLSSAFRNVVFAQVRISALNTFFTFLYLSVVLPVFGVHLPLTTTLVAITFATGLLPVLGNLISNTVVVIVSLSHSLSLALVSFAFLIAVHKLEYFLNARIIGARIHASAWELLIAMLVMEATFGIPGVLAAPIYYAYLKSELAEQGLV